MKKSIKHLSKSTLAVVLSLCMLISCAAVGIVATDAAKVTEQQAVSASVDNGASTGAALDGETAKAADAASDSDTAENIGASDDGAVGAAVDSDSAVSAANVYAVYGSWDNWANKTYFSGTTGSATATVNLAANSTYTFKLYSSYSGKSYGANDTFSATKSEYYFNTNTSTNATLKTSAAGTYTFTLKREDQGDGAINVGIKFPSAATYYTISKASTTNGSFTVNKTTATAGTNIEVTATPNRGYQVDTVTATGATVNNLGNNKYSFTMPSQAVTVTVTFKTATSRTLTAQVTSGTGTVTLTLSAGSTIYAAVTTSGTTLSSITAYDGETLTITAAPSKGYQLSELKRGTTTVSSGNTWTVKSGVTVTAKFTKSSVLPANQYNATLADDTASNPNLYTKIGATFFDYYTNGEISNGWYKGITGSEGWLNDSSSWDRNPYGYFNQALSVYAKNNTLARPMYFCAMYYGNNYWTGGNDEAYHDPGYYRSSRAYNGQKINDSNALANYNTALPGLSGKSISDGNIHYYGTGTNENGPNMVLFDKDWLTSRNTSSGTTTDGSKVYFDPGIWATYPNATFAAEVNDGGDNFHYTTLSRDANGAYYYDCSGYTTWKTIYFHLLENRTWKKKLTINNTSFSALSDKMVRITGDGNNNLNYDIIDYHGNDTKYSYGGALATIVNSSFPVRKETRGSGANAYTYYTFNSASGTDNVYFTKTDSNTFYKDSSNRLQLNYGNSDYKVVAGYNGTAGFFPFDRKADNSGKGKDLGFGMKLEIKFTLGPNGQINGNDQVFDFSGDDDLWVYVDNKLVLDLGGDHKQTVGKINFHDKSITKTQDTTLSNTRNTGIDIDNTDTTTVHTMTLYYMERGLHESNLMFGFSFNPLEDIYEVENVVDSADVNPGLQYLFNSNESFTFTNTSGDGKGKGVAYTQYKTSTGTKLGTGTTNDTTGNFTLKDDQYDEFKNIFTVNKNLRTQETVTSPFTYTTTYKVVDVQNGNKVIKAGSGKDTSNFNYLTTKENADPDFDMTHIRTTFTNTVDTTSFMLSKELIDYDDTSIEFPYTLVMYSNNPNNPYNLSGLKYKTSLDGYSTLHTYPANGTAIIHEDEYILFEGIPVGTHVMVYEPTVGDDYTPNIEGKANCFMDYNITHSNDTNTATFTKFPTDSSRNLIANVTLNSFDIITMYDELKTYCADYRLPTRLYGDKLYKLPVGKLTPAMVDAGYASVDDSAHTVSLTKAFVSAHIPYETIFMKNVNWNANNATYAIDSHGCNAYAYLAATSGNKKLTVKIDTNGNDIYDTTISDLDCGDPVLKSTDPVVYVSGTKDGDTPSRWEIRDNKGNFITNCYSQDFYYVAYDNYLVKAIYGEGKGKDLYDKFVSSDINNLGITRSHWNDTTSGSDDSPYYVDYGIEKTYSYYHKDTEYDRLYLDLSIAYNANGKLISTCSSSEVTVGYEILIMRENGALGKVYKDIVINNTDLDNKNRIHVYYGFSNSEANRGLKLAIRSYVSVNGGDKVYSEHVMPFELKTEGSK